MEQKIREAEAELPELLAAAKRIAIAEAEPSFSGSLRKEIRICRKLPLSIAKEAGINQEEFVQFLEGSAVLNSTQIDRLVACLGLQLVQANGR